MRAFLFDGEKAYLKEVPVPTPPSERYKLMKVIACGLCRTDIHILNGEIKPPKLPVIPGHQVVGYFPEEGKEKLYGISWLYDTCGKCFYCRRGEENLCDNARFTGFSVDGGLAEYILVPKDFVFQLPSGADPYSLAPLMCAGIIGYRTFKLGVNEDHENVALWGFGASAHIVIQILKYFGKRVAVFSRNRESLRVAEELGADWIGGYEDKPPFRIDSSLTFAPSTKIVARAVQLTRKGGTIAVNAIHLDEGVKIPFNYFYGEKKLLIVTNYTRRDGREFLELAAKIPVRTKYQVMDLEDIWDGINLMRDRKQRIAVVVRVER